MPRASIRPSRWSDEHVDRVRRVRQVRPAVADHVVGGDAEVARPGRRCRGRRPPGARRCRAAAPGPGPDPARSTRVRTPSTSTWRSSWSTSASSPQMLMCSGIGAHAVLLLEPGAGLGDGRQARALPAADARAGRAAGSSRWSGTRPGARWSRCSGGARSTAGCRRSRRSTRSRSRPRSRCGPSPEMTKCTVSWWWRCMSELSPGGMICRKISNVAVGSVPAMRQRRSGCAPGRPAAAPARRRARRSGARRSGVRCRRSRRGSRPCRSRVRTGPSDRLRPVRRRP